MEDTNPKAPRKCSAGHVQDPAWTTCPYCDAEKALEERQTDSGKIAAKSGHEEAARVLADTMDERSGELSAGSIVGDYTVRSRLGEGSFGVTYLARHNVLASDYVVKVASSTEKEQVERILHESRIEAKLSHPHIQSTVSAALLDDGRPYIVRNFVPGRSLDQLLEEKGTLCLKDALSVLEPIALALDYAHQLGVIHRDVKPSNILIPFTDGAPDFDGAVLTDFGLGGLRLGVSGVTRVGEVFGTPAYMSPEQFRGVPQDHRADVYSLGVLLYELLYGRRPFEADSYFEQARKALDGEFQFPASPNIPSYIQQAIRKCLSKSPYDRQAGVIELLSQLQLRPTPLGEQELPHPAFSIRWASSKVLWLLVVVVSVSLTLTYGAIDFERWSALLGSFDPKLFTGLLLVTGGLILGAGISWALGGLKPRYRHKAESILFGASDRSSLTESIAFEVDALIEQVKTLDQRVLVQSMALMLHEYRDAKDSPNRQQALMNAITLLDKLVTRLAPWYVRHNKTIAVAIAAIGVVPGVITAIKAVL